MRSPRISVYITSYNQKEYLIEAIESVLNQTLKPFEIIIVDDCSTDGSQKIIADYALRYPDLIKPIYHDQNMGIASTRNTALKAVQGDYVTFVDGDDRFLPNKIEKECQLFQINPSAHLVFSNFYSMTSEGRHLWLWADSESPPQGDIFRQTFTIDFPRGLHFRNELINYEAWKSVGFYDSKLLIYEDYEMRIRLTKKLHAVYNKEPAAEYRRHDGGLSALKIDYHLDNLTYLYQKNLHLLDDLPDPDRKQILKRINHKIAELIRGAAIRAIDRDRGSLASRILALKYYLKALKYQSGDPCFKLVSLMLIPYPWHLWLHKQYMRLKA